MSKILVMEAANLFCGDHDPNASKHLTLSEIQLPVLQEMYADHHAGGSGFQIEIAVGKEKMEAMFKLLGWDRDVMAQFGLGSGRSKVFTAYGVLKNTRDGSKQQVKAIMEGRLGKAESETYKRGELQHYDYAINAITRYTLEIDEQETIHFDFFANEWRVDGEDQNADERRILNLPV